MPVNQTRAIIAGTAMEPAFLKARYGSSRQQNIRRAIVFDVIPNPAVITPEERGSLEALNLNIATLDFMPRNTVIAQLVSSTAIADQKIVLFPFFSPHLSMPIKPGEYVWAFFEDPQTIEFGFWLSRIHETDQVDDINFTHGDRKYTADGNPNIPLDDDAERVASFPNGRDLDTKRTLLDPAAFDDIDKQALGNKFVRKEPVPRFTKRPGDMLLQGSNNAGIVLGEDRSAGLESGTADGLAGTIDIVAGRGTDFTTGDEAPHETSPATIKTSRGYSEVNKNSRAENEVNVREGDPDFVRDKVRIYASMRTDGDDNFDIVYPDNVLEAGKEPKKGRAYIIHKSDEIRIIARQDGAIHLIKEGENNASIILHANGTVQIDAEKIQLGRDVGNDKGFVRYSQYNSQMTDLMNALKEYFQNVSTLFAANASPGYGAPNVPVTNAGTKAGEAAAKVKAVLRVLDQARSTKIFGE